MSDRDEEEGEAKLKLIQEVDDEPTGESAGEEKSETRNPLHYLFNPAKLAQICARLFILVVTVLLIVGAYIGVNLVASQSESFRFGVSDPFELLVDNCDITVIAGVEDKLVVEVNTEQNTNVQVSQNGSAISVQNKKDPYDKYMKYSCRIAIKVPVNFKNSLPPLKVTALGKRRTSFFAEVYNWTSLQFTTRQPSAQFSVRLSKAKVTLGGNVLFNSTAGSLWIDSFTNLQLTLPVGLRPPCLAAATLTCQLPTQSPYAENCTQAFLSNNGTSAFVNVTLASAATDLHVVVRQKDASLDDLVMNEDHPTTIGLSDEAKARVLVPFTPPPAPELVYYKILGPGAPDGVWSFTRNPVYNYFSTPFLQVSTFGLLSPVSKTVTVSLSPSACPGINRNASLNNLVPIYSVMSTILNGQLKSKSDVVAFLASAELGSKVWTIQIDPDSGEYYNTWSADSQIYMGVAILDGILTGLTGIGVTYVVFKNLGRYRKRKVESWGRLYYGERFPAKRQQLHATADIFFMLEFVIGFPGMKLNVFRSVLTVWVHMFTIILPAFPIFVASKLYGDEVMRITEKEPMISIIGEFLGLAYLLFALTCLVLYYISFYIPWRVRQVIGWLFAISATLMTFLSVSYLVQTAFWLLLGSLIKPEQILPFASVTIIAFAQVLVTYTRVRQLVGRMRTEQKKRQKEIAREKDPDYVSSSDESDSDVEVEVGTPNTPQSKAVTVTGRLQIADTMALLQGSRLLELTDSSIRERIANEVIRFFILLGFFLFVLFGFQAFGSTTLASGISTGLILLAGGGVNIPAAQPVSEDDEDKTLQKRIRADKKKKKAKAN